MKRGKFLAAIIPLVVFLCALCLLTACASESEAVEVINPEVSVDKTDEERDDEQESGGEPEEEEPDVWEDPDTDATLKPSHVHSAVHTEYSAPTCTEAGNTEYWHCADCNKYFSDADCRNEISGSGIVLSPNGHTTVTDAAIEATCTHTGLTEGSHCSECGAVFTEQTVIGIADHKFVNGLCISCGEWQESMDLEFRDLGEGYAVSGVGDCLAEYIRIPESYKGKPVVQIDDYAFSGCDGIKGLIVSDTVKEIGASAFGDCSNLEQVDLGNGVTELGICAFERCVNLKTAVLSQNLKALNMLVFGSCRSLTKIAVPASVERIDYYAFSDCVSLNRVLLSVGIKEIAEWAFAECAELTEIIFDGTTEEWNRVINSAEGNYTVRCSDGTL
ncbi:MAG: leucine-rich repeat domain-containing protein [Clostridia bacterium]|nr:leucine-rich repeat domain-containing protein [Clostridia bacterium]